jgi:uncharacterized protein YbjT (DUF2867 family)
MTRVLVAGASGFIGKALIEQLLLNEGLEIVALSRKERESKHPRLKWKKCDLFSLKDVREAMEGCDSAYYLVHSMIPSASLSQGSFYDFDLLMADNFARAAKQFQIQQVIYLGGMIPKGIELSWHLRSRLEVEDTFRNWQVPLTTLRAGLIVGPNGSSFTILQKLVERLPLMVCPSWTLTQSQPVALKDIVRVLVKSLNRAETLNRIFDIGGPDIVTYQQLLFRTALMSGRHPKIINFNIIPLGLSRFWVSIITGTSKDLVYPLVLSLKYPMLAAPIISGSMLQI